MQLRNFSLRALFLCLTVLASFLAFNIDRARRQRDFINSLQGKLGWARYSWQFDKNGAFDPNATPPLPGWLLQRIGPDHFFSVTDVSLLSDVREVRTEWLHGNSNLRSLLLDAGSNQACLNCIRNNRHLKELHIVLNGKIDFSFVPETPNLEVLWIEHSSIQNISRLGELRKLRYLRFEGCDLSELIPQDMARLQSLRKLEVFSMDYDQTLSRENFDAIKAMLPNCTVN